MRWGGAPPHSVAYRFPSASNAISVGLAIMKDVAGTAGSSTDPGPAGVFLGGLVGFGGGAVGLAGLVGSAVGATAVAGVQALSVRPQIASLIRFDVRRRITFSRRG